MKRSNYPNNNKGMTLVEMIVALVLLGVVLSAIYTFFQFGNKMSENGSEQYTLQSESRSAIAQITSDIKYANELSLLSVKPTSSEKLISTYSYIYMENGTIFRSIYNAVTGIRTETTARGTYMLPESYFSKVTGAADSLKIQLSSEYDAQAYEVDTQIKLANLSLSSPAGSVQGSTSSQVIKFKVPIN